MSRSKAELIRACAQMEHLFGSFMSIYAYFRSKMLPLKYNVACSALVDGLREVEIIGEGEEGNHHVDGCMRVFNRVLQTAAFSYVQSNATNTFEDEYRVQEEESADVEWSISFDGIHVTADGHENDPRPRKRSKSFAKGDWTFSPMTDDHVSDVRAFIAANCGWFHSKVVELMRSGEEAQEQNSSTVDVMEKWIARSWDDFDSLVRVTSRQKCGKDDSEETGTDDRPDQSGFRDTSTTLLSSVSSTRAFWKFIMENEELRSRVVHVEHQRARPVKYGSIPSFLHADVVRMFFPPEKQPYFHQSQAITYLELGEKVNMESRKSPSAGETKSHVIISTSTASGKSLCYQVPIINYLCQKDSSYTALYISPTKALAQDQLRSLTNLLLSEFGSESAAEVPSEESDFDLRRLRAAIYDGDIAFADRLQVRGAANMLLINPDILHHDILPKHRMFEKFWRGLIYVVVDEAHTYTGIFGTHIAYVLRRFRRLLRRCYGVDPKFIACSATLTRPGDHLSALIGAESDSIGVVDVDCSPAMDRLYMLWNPPLKQPTKPSEKGVVDLPDENDAACDEMLEQPSPLPAALFDEDPVPGLVDIVRQFEERKRTRIGAEAGTQPDLREIVDNVTDSGTTSTAYVPDMDTQRIKAIYVHHQRPERQRVSTFFESANVCTWLLRFLCKNICFCKVRSVTEVIMRYMRINLSKYEDGVGKEIAKRVVTYRGGFVPSERRLLERRISNGDIDSIVATNALELGVDIGLLDAVVHVGFPGSIASYLQQAGRAGRRMKDTETESGVEGALVPFAHEYTHIEDDLAGRPFSLSILMLFDSPLEQYYGKHPETLFSTPVESAIIDTDNVLLFRRHMLCAAYELPLDSVLDAPFFAPPTASSDSDNVFECLLSVSSFKIERRRQRGSTAYRFLVKGVGNPGRNVNLRSSEDKSYALVEEDSEDVIDTLDGQRAFFEVFEGSVYRHQGREYLVVQLCQESLKAVLRPVRVNYYTKKMDVTDVDVLTCRNSIPIEGTGSIANFGDVRVCTGVYGYRQISKATHKVLKKFTFSPLCMEYPTKAVWINVPPSTIALVRKEQLSADGGIHALRHVLLSVLPMFVIAVSPSDVHTECISLYARRYRPYRLIVYDKHRHGAGISSRLVWCMKELLNRCQALLDGCSCLHGCTRCIFLPQCSEYNEVLDKAAASVILRSLLQADRLQSTVGVE